MHLNYLFTIIVIVYFNFLKVPAFSHRTLKLWRKRDCVHPLYCAIYTNVFAVQIKGGPVEADQLANVYGFSNLGPIWGITDYYEFIHPRVKIISRRHSPRMYGILRRDERVVWFEQQKVKFNEQRSYEYKEEIPVEDEELTDESAVFGLEAPILQEQLLFNDPLYVRQWYLHGGASYGFDMNIIDAWSQGYTGSGVVVSILDDGVQADHPDLIHSYDPLASIDLLHGVVDHPLPHRIPFKHGTRCAGEVAAQANNHICGVGIAFHARVGGIRILDTLLTDSREARAISFNNGYIQIFSASWGPADNGRSLGGPGTLAKRALYNGVNKGRNGLGVLYVWAAGNGGKNGDNCNADGYANSIYTITISSANKYGLKPWYVEECASTISTTYSSGINGSRLFGVVTTDLITAPNVMANTLPREKMCTTTAGGTSASAPIAAAICALVLQANPMITWRDMQHLIVQTSRFLPLSIESGWRKNAAGKMYSHKFGFGLMDAAAMIELAKRWKAVPSMKTCKTKMFNVKRTIPSHKNSKLEVMVNSNNCKRYVSSLEHVEAVLTIRFKPRGNLEILLSSSSGTVSQLLRPRPNDLSADVFSRWSFTSIHFWGERPEGFWNLTVVNSGEHKAKTFGKLYNYQLIFHGL